MLWDIQDKKDYVLYINRDIDLKIKVLKVNNKAELHMNYKGFNLTIPMLVWEFGEDLKLASIENVSIEGEGEFNKYFVINEDDIDTFLDEVYFFLVENNMDSVLRERYLVNW